MATPARGEDLIAGGGDVGDGEGDVAEPRAIGGGGQSRQPIVE